MTDRYVNTISILLERNQLAHWVLMSKMLANFASLDVLITHINIKNIAEQKLKKQHFSMFAPTVWINSYYQLQVQTNYMDNSAYWVKP